MAVPGCYASLYATVGLPASEDGFAYGLYLIRVRASIVARLGVSLKSSDLLRAWGRVLMGYSPVLSIEITKQCPLTCPGCYAFHPDHLDGRSLTSLADFKGDSLITGVLELIERKRPVTVFLVGGEPLVRFRELEVLIPEICKSGTYVRLVTSAVRPIPAAWARLPELDIIVSIDGLQAEHDARRKPATYERILKNIRGHRITVHCTVTSQMMQRKGYLTDFVDFWNDHPDITGIWVSFFTPQVGEESAEILTPEMRRRAVAELDGLWLKFPKLKLSKDILNGYLSPPESPDECLFARATECVSADLKTEVTPCQFGGNPNCGECGCMASAGLYALSRRRLPGGLSIGSLADLSLGIGRLMGAARGRSR